MRYRPLRWYNLDRLNNRTHRKLLIVDGRVGFTGGIGVADHWLGNAEDKEHWRDSHFQVEGPVVAQLQGAFMDNWIESRGEVMDGADYFPQLEPVGGHYAQVFRSSPGEGSASMRLMYLLAIASAAKSIRIANAYFVPDSLVRDMLVQARDRGVDVEIIVPGPVLDAQIVRRASRAKWGPLLRAGVRIYEYQPTMYHTKVMVVDEVWSSVGSTNFDDRSFRLNDEANLNVLDPEFGQRAGARLRGRPGTLAGGDARGVGAAPVQGAGAGTVREAGEIATLGAIFGTWLRAIGWSETAWARAPRGSHSRWALPALRSCSRWRSPRSSIPAASRSSFSPSRPAR